MFEAFTDFIVNGEGHGAVAQQLGACRYDTGLLRPYFNRKGEKCATINTGRFEWDEKAGIEKPVHEEFTINELRNMGIDSPVFNATALRKDAWLKMDLAILRAARQRLKAWGDLAAANTMGGFDGMSKMILEHQTMSDPGEAIVDMDGITEGRADSPLFEIEALPLPITHQSFHFSARNLAVARSSGTPLDTAMGEAAARRVAEKIEQTTIGVIAGESYGDANIYGRDSGAPAKVYGYTNFPDRITKTDMTTPAAGTTGPTVHSSWLALRDLLYVDRFYGPFMAYVSADYDQFLDSLLTTAEPSAGTLRSLLLKIDGIRGIRRLDFLTDTFTVIFVQMTSDVARAINGMDITTVQWESKGGMQINFKVMAIHVPQLRADYNGRCGIAVGTTS